MRSDNPADRAEVSRGLSRQAQTSKVSRRRDQQNPGVSLQQFSVARYDHCPALQTALAGGTLLQVDQAASTHQEFLWYYRERCEDPDLDRHFRLSDCGDHQKTAEFAGESLHNFTGFERFPIRKNIIVSNTYILRSQKRHK